MQQQKPFLPKEQGVKENIKEIKQQKQQEQDDQQKLPQLQILQKHLTHETEQIYNEKVKELTDLGVSYPKELPQLKEQFSSQFQRRKSIYYQNKRINILVSKKPWGEKGYKYFKLICEYLIDYAIIDINVYVETINLKQLEEKKVTKLTDKIIEFINEEQCKIDYIITVGGDGNLQWMSKIFQKTSVPTLISFACGTRNFLCYYQVEDYEKILNSFLEVVCQGQNYIVDKRKRLKVTLNQKGEKKQFHAFNDCVIERDGPGLARMNIYLNKIFFLKLYADGIIVSTSSGSTAYSLSAGGSILHPQVFGSVLTPICSITTSLKPVVIPEFIVVDIENDKDARTKTHLSIDGHTTIVMEKEDTVQVETSTYPFEFFVEKSINPLTHWVQKLGKIYHYNEEL